MKKDPDFWEVQEGESENEDHTMVMESGLAGAGVSAE